MGYWRSTVMLTTPNTIRAKYYATYIVGAYHSCKESLEILVARTRTWDFLMEGYVFGEADLDRFSPEYSYEKVSKSAKKSRLCSHWFHNGVCHVQLFVISQL